MCKLPKKWEDADDQVTIVFVWPLISLEHGVFLDQSLTEVRQNQSNPGILTRFIRHPIGNNFIYANK